MNPRIKYQQVAEGAIKALYGVESYIASSSIDPKLRALVKLRASQINGCAYCVDMHSHEARHAGETQQRLDCLPVWHETSFYSERERAALALAESVTLVSETHIPDDVFEAARAQFSEKELVDLMVILGMINLWNRVAIGFRQGPAQRAER